MTSEKVCLCGLLGPKSPASGDDAFCSPGTGTVAGVGWVVGWYFHLRDLFPAFRGTKDGQRVLLTPAVS